jgi:hypothetical protein
MPLYVHASSPVVDVTLDTVVAILSGRIASWEEVSGIGSGPIKLYLHGGALQSKKFSEFTRSLLGVDSSQSACYAGSYSELKLLAGRDPWCLVAGLREVDTSGLKSIAVNGQQCSGKTRRYPLRTSINYALRHGASPLLLNEFVRAAEKRYALDNR